MFMRLPHVKQAPTTQKLATHQQNPPISAMIVTVGSAFGKCARALSRYRCRDRSPVSFRRASRPTQRVIRTQKDRYRQPGALSCGEAGLGDADRVHKNGVGTQNSRTLSLQCMADSSGMDGYSWRSPGLGALRTLARAAQVRLPRMDQKPGRRVTTRFSSVS